MYKSSYVPYLDDMSEDGDGPSPKTSHPAYVAVAPEWFWDFSNEQAPFSSDDGHDMLSTLDEHYRTGGGDEHAVGCVASVITDWGLVPEQIWDSNQEEIVAWLNADDAHARFIHGEIDAYIAAACGQFKISGWIHPALNFWAFRATMLLEHILDDWETQNHGGEKGRYTQRLEAVRAVLNAAPEPPEEFQHPMYNPVDNDA